MKRGLIIALVCAPLWAAPALPRVPQNLDFRDGPPNAAPPGWRLTNPAFSAERRADCQCAVIAFVNGDQHTATDFAQTIDAALLRGRPVFLKASLRTGGGPAGYVQLWIRVNRPKQSSGLLVNADKAVRSDQWSPSEVSLIVNSDADSIDFGVTAAGPGPVWIRDLSFETRALTRLTSDPYSLAPRNLGFMDGNAGHLPAFWTGAGTILTEGCYEIGPCAAVHAPQSLQQTFAAEAFRGALVQLSAWAKVTGAGPDNAHVWITADKPTAGKAETTRTTTYRKIEPGDWVPVSVDTKIDPNAYTVVIGVTAFGGANVTIDQVFFDIVPELRETNTALPLSGVTELPNRPTEMRLAATMTSSVEDEVADRPKLPQLSAAELEEKRAEINRAAAKAARYAADLPDFLCTQIVHRSESRNRRTWHPRDTLTIQLSYADHAEHYKLQMINNRRALADYEDMKGAISEGEFDSMIVELFSPRVAKFQWLRRERLRRVETDVFFYEVAKERSGYMVGFGDNLPTRQTAIVGYYGFVYIDPATGDILRIERTARLPKDFPIRKSVTTLDYEFTRIAGQLYLLPFKAQTNLDSASIQTRNDVEFRNYRRFEADTKILFDKP